MFGTLFGSRGSDPSATSDVREPSPSVSALKGFVPSAISSSSERPSPSLSRKTRIVPSV